MLLVEGQGIAALTKLVLHAEPQQFRGHARRHALGDGTAEAAEDVVVLDGDEASLALAGGLLDGVVIDGLDARRVVDARLVAVTSIEPALMVLWRARPVARCLPPPTASPVDHTDLLRYARTGIMVMRCTLH